MSPTLSTQIQQQDSPSSRDAMATQNAPDAARAQRMLTFEILTRTNDKADGLRLIVDSVAQQRQVASRALIFHPICFSVLIAAISLIHINIDKVRNDYGTMMVTYSGIVISYLVAVRYVTSPYIQTAEKTDWYNWLAGDDGADDLMLGARFGSEIIASVVLRLPKKSSRKKASRSKKAVIRAWTTKLRFRHHGLGGDMLREAIKLSRKTLGPDCVIEFAQDHANSTLLQLPETFNATFAKRDKRAQEELQDALQELDAADKAQQ